MKLELVEKGGTGIKGQPGPGEQPPREAIEAVRVALHAGNYGRAEDLAERLATDYWSTETHGLWYRALTRDQHPRHLSDGAQRRATDILKPLLEAEPQPETAMAFAACAGPQDPTVLEYLARAHRRRPRDPFLTDAYSKALAEHGYPLKSLLVWRHALKARRPEALWQAGRALARSNKPLRALPAFLALPAPTHAGGLDARLAAAVVALSAGHPGLCERILPEDSHLSRASRLLTAIVHTRLAAERGDAKGAWREWAHALQHWCELGGHWEIHPPRLSQAPGLRLDITPSMAAAWRSLKPLSRYKPPASGVARARNLILAAFIEKTAPNPSDLQRAEHPCFGLRLAEHFLALGEVYSATGSFARYARLTAQAHQPVAMPMPPDDLPERVRSLSATDLKSTIKLARRTLPDAYIALPYYRTVLRHIMCAAGDMRTQLTWARWLKRLHPDAPDLAADAGIAAAKLGRTRQAIRYLEQAHYHWPDNAEVGTTLGFCLESLGSDPGKVVRIYTAAVDANPDNKTLRSRYEAALKRQAR